jgi:peptide/nickel transport system substrate-binding protein
MNKRAITKVQSAIVIVIIVIAAFAVYYGTTGPGVTPTTTTQVPVTGIPVTTATSAIVTTSPGLGKEDYVYLTDLSETGDADPVDCSGNNCRSVIVNTMDQLVWYSGKGALGEPEPQLADKWTISPDGLTYTFHIREDVKFWDGTPVTPADVRYIYGRFLAYSNPTAYVSLLLPWLTGHSAGEYISWEEIQKAITIDDAANTISFHLTKPTAVFLTNLAYPVFGVYSASYAMSRGSWVPGQNATGQSDPKMQSGENIMASGPFRLTELVAGQKYVLTRNDNYWRGPAKIRTLTVLYVPEWSTRLLMLQRGQADAASVTADVASQVVTDPNLVLFTANSGFTEAIFFNFDIPLNRQPGGTQGITRDWFRDVHLRRAFAYAFPYDDYAKQAYLGYAEVAGPDGWLPLGQLGSTANSYPYSYDPAKATEEFKLAWDGKVWENGFTIAYGYQDFQKGPALIGGQLFAQSLQSINPKFKLVPALGNWPAFFDWPIQMAVNNNGPDPNWLYDVYGSGGTFPPYTHYSDKNVDKILVEAATTTDPAARQKLYDQANKLIAEEVPAILTVYWPFMNVQTKNLQGYIYSPGWVIDPGYCWYISKT